MTDKSDEELNRDYLTEKVLKARSMKFFSNLYALEMLDKASAMWELGDEFIIAVKDNSVNRLFFFVEEISHFSNLLNIIPSGEYFFEMMTKKENENVPEESNLVAKLMRMANKDCSSVFREESEVMKYRQEVYEEKASEADAEEINEILWNTFRPEVSHLLSEAELTKKIVEGSVTIHRNEHNKIDAILQADVTPKKFYINQIVNKTNREVIHTILLNRLERYVTNGGMYLYAWVESDNLASLKFHRKYGMEHDGMYNLVYRVEKKNDEDAYRKSYYL